MADNENNEFDNPDRTDFHGRKRELLKEGLEKGSLSWDEIRKALPEEHLTDTELEVLLFTCKNMGIEVTGDSPV
ncbi:MAG: RNA polymerase sigma factor region1.1 domain-containing protein [Persicimonas sp.]